MNKQDKIKEVASTLLAMGPTTTLDIKNVLRNRVDTGMEIWTQQEVSDAMIEFEANQDIPGLAYTDNGQFRTYDIVQQITQSSTTSTTTPTSTPIRLLSRTKVVKEIIDNNRGSWLTVTFIKKDKTERSLNGRPNKTAPMSPLGYINFITNKGDIKQVNPRTILSVKMHGEILKVK